MNRFSEEYEVSCLPIRITSATTFYAPAVSMKGQQSVTFIVSMGTAVGGQGVSITAQQGANATVAESSNAAAITGATATLGSTVGSSYVSKAKTARIYLSTATTDAETLIINSSTFTYLSTGAATASQFGATAGASAAAGVAIAMLASAINAACTNLTATTGASWVDIAVKDSASTSITITSTMGGLTPAYLSAQSILSIMVPGLDSTSEYVSCVVSSASTAFNGSIVVVKKAMRTPARAHGQIVNDVNT
jgi:hypothetical protein